MLRGKYIDGAHLILTGGEITDESAIWRDDLEDLLPAAVNWGVQAGLWDQLKMEKDYDLPGSFIGTFEDLDLDVTDPAEPFFYLPKTVIPMSSDRGIRMIYTPKGQNIYERMGDNLFSNWSYYKNIMVGQRFYRNCGKTASGEKIKLYNSGPLESAVCVRMVVSTEDYDDTEHLPVPLGQELVVIAKLVELFREQRNTRTDKIEDGSDIN